MAYRCAHDFVSTYKECRDNAYVTNILFSSPQQLLFINVRICHQQITSLVLARLLSPWKLINLVQPVRTSKSSVIPPLYKLINNKFIQNCLLFLLSLKLLHILYTNSSPHSERSEPVFCNTKTKLSLCIVSFKRNPWLKRGLLLIAATLL